MQIDEDRIRAIGRTIDDLVTMELRQPGPRSSIVKPLLDAVFQHQSGSPSAAAANALADSVTPGDTVIIATGAGDGRIHLPNGETDGPPGAVSLARALALGLGARPIITVEDHCLTPQRRATHAGGLNVVAYDQLQERANGATIRSFSKDPNEATEQSIEFLDTYDPTAVIAVEKVGPNDAGVIHSANGTDVSEGRAKVAPLFDRATDRDILTVGIGDNGNEIGFGNISAAVRDIQPYGATCECSCGGGLACRVSTDHLLVGNVSNWAAYGLSALLAIRTNTPSALHSAEDERRMLEHLVVAGSNDGVYDRPRPMVDGTATATQTGIVSILNNLVTITLTDRYDRGY
jgi:hypothetical protein